MATSRDDRKTVVIVKLTEQPGFEEKYNIALARLEEAAPVEYAKSIHAMWAALNRDIKPRAMLFADGGFVKFLEAFEALRPYIDRYGRIEKSPEAKRALESCFIDGVGQGPLMSPAACAVDRSYNCGDGEIVRSDAVFKDLMKYAKYDGGIVNFGLDFSTSYYCYSNMNFFWRRCGLTWTMPGVDPKRDDYIQYSGSTFPNMLDSAYDRINIFPVCLAHVEPKDVVYMHPSHPAGEKVAAAWVSFQGGGALAYVGYTDTGDAGSPELLVAMCTF